MCDYSLCGIPNRLAAEGEELVVHRFSTGSMGLASRADLRLREPVREIARKQSFWQSLKSFFEPTFEKPVIPAVCIPPGAHLILKDIPGDLQRQCNVAEEEGVMFTQLNAEANSYRDAIRFNNGYRMRLQDLREGMRVEVLSLANAEEYTPVMTEALR